MSVITKQLHKMPYDKAVAAAKIMSEAVDATDEAKAEYAAALESHPGKNGKAPDVATEAKSKALGKAERKSEILRKLASSEIDPETAGKELAMLDGDVDLEGILNLDAIATYPTRSLGEKGNRGWFFGGPVKIGDHACKVSMNIIIKK